MNSDERSGDDEKALTKQESEGAPELLDPEQYVQIARYLEPFEAQMAKGVLESASLECFLHGENANNLMAPAFRARLMVHKKDEEEARRLLETPDEGAALADTEEEDDE